MQCIGLRLLRRCRAAKTPTQRNARLHSILRFRGRLLALSSIQLILRNRKSRTA